jgi:hypothetical protein
VAKQHRLNVSALLRAEAGSFHYCSIGLPTAAAADVHPLAPLDVGEVEAQAAEARLWLHSAGATTQAHYDTSHNFFVQIRERKRVWLWPPAAHSALRFFPSRHSLHRQSSLHSPTTEARGAGMLAMTLYPGDALYIPPYWAHHLEALGASISVAVWSESAAATRKDTLEYSALPFEAEWSRSRTLLCAAEFLRLLLISAHGSAAAGRAALAALLRSRYEPLRELEAAERESLVRDAAKGSAEGGAEGGALQMPCGATANAAQRAELREHARRGAEALGAAVIGVSSDAAVREIVAGDYVEQVAEFVAGREELHGFLEQCCLAPPWPSELTLLTL